MDSGKPDFIVLDHTADLGIKVRGSDLINLFENAANSMMHIMVRDRHAQKSDAIRADSKPARFETGSIKISVDGQDLADLLVLWLGEILYLFSGENKLVMDVKIDSISTSHIDSTLETIRFDPNIHEILCEIKAVTYHQSEVAETDDHYWEAGIIFDL